MRQLCRLIKTCFMLWSRSQLRVWLQYRVAVAVSFTNAVTCSLLLRLPSCCNSPTRVVGSLYTSLWC